MLSKYSVKKKFQVIVLSVTVHMAFYCCKLFDFFSNKDSCAALKLSLLLYLKLTFTPLIYLFTPLTFSI